MEGNARLKQHPMETPSPRLPVSSSPRLLALLQPWKADAGRPEVTTLSSAHRASDLGSCGQAISRLTEELPLAFRSAFDLWVSNGAPPSPAAFFKTGYALDIFHFNEAYSKLITKTKLGSNLKGETNRFKHWAWMPMSQ